MVMKYILLALYPKHELITTTCPSLAVMFYFLHMVLEMLFISGKVPQLQHKTIWGNLKSQQKYENGKSESK